MIVVAGSDANAATVDLVVSWRKLGLPVELVPGPGLAALPVGAHDVVLGRLDVVPTLDGVEPGLLQLLLLERRGVPVLNTAPALVAAHDKLRSARVLVRAGIPHPPTVHVRAPVLPRFPGPYVVKPRCGSWGRDVFLCRDNATLLDRLADVGGRSWFRRHGALVQQAIANDGHDVRIVVAGGCVVGVAERTAAPGEWRTNVSCGGELRPADLDPAAGELARTVAAVIGGDLVGVDVMPTTRGGWIVLEVNGAVEFDDACGVAGSSLTASAASALGLLEDAAARRRIA